MQISHGFVVRRHVIVYLFLQSLALRTDPAGEHGFDYYLSELERRHHAVSSSAPAFRSHSIRSNAIAASAFPRALVCSRLRSHQPLPMPAREKIGSNLI